jgi:hypothetical protein
MQIFESTSFRCAGDMCDTAWPNRACHLPLIKDEDRPEKSIREDILVLFGVN